MLKRCLEECEKLTVAEKRKLRKKLNEQLKEHDREKELTTLANYISRKWETCYFMREKIDNEGMEYFYNDYCNVPVSWELYTEFCNNSADCYCGTEGGCKEEEYDDDDDGCTCIKEPGEREETPCCYFSLCRFCLKERVNRECEECSNTKLICDYCRENQNTKKLWV